MICLGILGALLVNVALPVTDWRTMFNLAAIPAALLLLGMVSATQHVKPQPHNSRSQNPSLLTSQRLPVHHMGSVICNMLMHDAC
jgi:predicted MFS family arabinose efflux permease